jgi:hypothetical protein
MCTGTGTAVNPRGRQQWNSDWPEIPNTGPQLYRLTTVYSGLTRPDYTAFKTPGNDTRPSAILNTM